MYLFSHVEKRVLKDIPHIFETTDGQTKRCLEDTANQEITSFHKWSVGIKYCLEKFFYVECNWPNWRVQKRSSHQSENENQGNQRKTDLYTLTSLGKAITEKC